MLEQRPVVGRRRAICLELRGVVGVAGRKGECRPGPRMKFWKSDRDLQRKVFFILKTSSKETHKKREPPQLSVDNWKRS